LIPVKAGGRVKTARHDAMMLAKLYRAGELAAVRVPDTAHGVMRDLVRVADPVSCIERVRARCARAMAACNLAGLPKLLAT